jgi:hypothetical protein
MRKFEIEEQKSSEKDKKVDLIDIFNIIEHS